MSDILGRIDDTLDNWHGSADSMHWRPETDDEPAAIELGEAARALPQIGQPRGLWFDKQGQPIDAVQADTLLRDRDYSRIGLTRIWSRADRSVDWRVSTVWLATNYAFLGGPPILFETMVFGHPLGELQWRWSTEEQARAGHASIVADLTRPLARPRLEECARWTGPSLLDGRYRQRQKNRTKRHR